MKKLILIVFVVFTLNVWGQSGERNFIDQNYIEVTGKAEMKVIPNEIYMKIVVDENDFNGKQKLPEVEKLMKQKLVGLGIDVSKQLSVKDMVSNFKKYWLKGKEINAEKEYQLKVGDATTAGKVIRALAAIGVSNISIEKIAHSEIQKYRKEVKINAIKAAKEKAASLTNAIGQNIGKAIYIEEVNNSIYDFRGRAAGLSNIKVKELESFDDLDDGGHPEIEFEKIKLEYSILARFAIE